MTALLYFVIEEKGNYVLVPHGCDFASFVSVVAFLSFAL